LDFGAGRLAFTLGFEIGRLFGVGCRALILGFDGTGRLFRVGLLACTRGLAAGLLACTLGREFTLDLAAGRLACALDFVLGRRLRFTARLTRSITEVAQRPQERAHCVRTSWLSFLLGRQCPFKTSGAQLKKIFLKFRGGEKSLINRCSQFFRFFCLQAKLQLNF
jgi:hypothetical protein